MNATHWKILFQLNDLNDIILEGILYLLNAKDNYEKIVRNDVLEAIGVLKTSLSGQNLLTLETERKMEELYRNINTADTQMEQEEMLAKISNQVFEAVDTVLIYKLLSVIKEYTFMDRDTTEEFLTFLHKRHVQTPDLNNMIFLIGLSSCISAPKQSYEMLLKLFQNEPDILYQSKGQKIDLDMKSEQKTFHRCPICNHEGTPYLSAPSYVVKHFESPFLPMKLWMRCEGCHNLYTYQFPVDFLSLSEQNQIIYPQKDKYLDTVAFSDGNQLKKWCDVLNNIYRYTDKKRLLEVGVGKGELLAVALELGYETEAVELVSETAQSIANLLDIPIWNCDFLNFNPGRTYPVITMGDVLEHMSDPNKALEKVYDLLEEDGVLWLSTPNFESSFSRLCKFRDPMWKEPLHITYFSRHSIQKLLSDHGFKIVQYNVSNRYNGSMELIVRKNPS